MQVKMSRFLLTPTTAHILVLLKGINHSQSQNWMVQTPDWLIVIEMTVIGKDNKNKICKHAEIDRPQVLVDDASWAQLFNAADNVYFETMFYI